MKITVFNGSPRGEKSNTHIMVKEFLEGAKKVGAETENIFLFDKKIHHCTGCYTCWLKTPGKCVFQDDMAELLEKSVNTDIIVYASPVYIGSVTGIMKNFLDRHVALGDPRFEKDENGNYRHFERNKTKKEIPVVLISNCGFPEQYHFEYFRSVFEYMERASNMKIIAEIFRDEGELLRVEHLLLKPIQYGYKKLLRKAGKEVVENMSLSEKTKKELIKPLVPYDMYVKNATNKFEEILNKLNKDNARK